MATLAANRNYRLLFSASAISNLGDGVSALAFPWLATLLTRDPVLISLVAVATRLPWFLFAVPAGVITDRADRKRLMVQADLFRLVLTMGVIGLIATVPTLPHEGDARIYIAALAGLAFLLGSAEVLRDNAAQTILPSVVEPAQLEAANGRLWSIEQVMGSFIGPPLAGFLIAMAVPLPFALDALTFGLAAWLVWMMTTNLPAKGARSGFWSELKEGARWMLAHLLVLRLAILLGCLNAVATAFLTILVLYSQEILGLGAVGHGMLLTAGAAGGVLGGLIGPEIVKRLGPSVVLTLGIVLFMTEPLAVWLTSSVALVAIGQFVTMFAAVNYNIVTVSFRQRAIPDDLLGRVNSIYRFFGWGMMPIGALAGGLIVSALEPTWGREAAIRAPYMFGVFAMGAMALYAGLTIRLPKPD